MKVKRFKKYKKYVNFYKVVYKFRAPFKVLIDGNFLHQATTSDFNLRDNLYKLLSDTPLLIMTKCVMRELELLSKTASVRPTLLQAKKVIKESCKHSGGILPAEECIRNFVGKRNEAQVFVGTNDEELRNELRNLGTVPIFFFQRGVLVMDAPAEVTEEKHKMVRAL